MTAAERAGALFCRGYNCAQSVAGAFSDEMGLPLDTVTQLVSGFGGGMGGRRETCGAVTGMMFAAGMLFGYHDPQAYEEKKALYELIRELTDQFIAVHETAVCRELLAALPGKLEQTPQKRTEEYYKVRPCVRFVETAAAIFEQELKRRNKR